MKKDLIRLLKHSSNLITGSTRLHSILWGDLDIFKLIILSRLSRVHCNTTTCHLSKILIPGAGIIAIPRKKQETHELEHTEASVSNQHQIALVQPSVVCNTQGDTVSRRCNSTYSNSICEKCHSTDGVLLGQHKACVPDGQLKLPLALGVTLWTVSVFWKEYYYHLAHCKGKDTTFICVRAREAHTRATAVETCGGAGGSRTPIGRCVASHT